MIIVSGGIDLSVGSIIALSTVVTALLLRHGRRPARRGARRGRRRGALCGALNGCSSRASASCPFIVTLGTMLLVRGAAKGLADERRIEAPITWLNDLLRTARDGTRLAAAVGHLDHGGARAIVVGVHAAATRGSAVISSRSDRTSGPRGCAACGSTARKLAVYTAGRRARGAVRRAAVLEAVGRRSDGRARARARRDRRGDHRRRQPARRARAASSARSPAPRSWRSSRSAARSRGCRTGCSRSSPARSSCSRSGSIAGGRRPHEGVKGAGALCSGDAREQGGAGPCGGRRSEPDDHSRPRGPRPPLSDVAHARRHRRRPRRSRLLGGLRDPADRRRPRGPRPDVHDRTRQRSLRRRDRAFRHLVVGQRLDDITADFAGFWRSLASDSQLRWLGPGEGRDSSRARRDRQRGLGSLREGRAQAGVEAAAGHDAAAAGVVHRLPLHHRRADARRGDRDARAAGADARAIASASCCARGYPAYTTSVGWMGYSRRRRFAALCREAIADGWTHFKVKVGGRPEDDRRRVGLVRDEIGADRKLMIDANQQWDVRRGDRARPRARAIQSVVDRGADQPGRCARTRDDCEGGARARHRRRDRRALRQPDHVQAAAAGAAPSTSARSTAAVSAA